MFSQSSKLLSRRRHKRNYLRSAGTRALILRVTGRHALQKVTCRSRAVLLFDQRTCRIRVRRMCGKDRTAAECGCAARRSRGVNAEAGRGSNLFWSIEDAAEMGRENSGSAKIDVALL